MPNSTWITTDLDTVPITVPCMKCAKYVSSRPDFGICTMIIAIEHDIAVKELAENYMKLFHNRGHVE